MLHALLRSNASSIGAAATRRKTWESCTPVESLSSNFRKCFEMAQHGEDAHKAWGRGVTSALIEEAAHAWSGS